MIEDPVGAAAGDGVEAEEELANYRYQGRLAPLPQSLIELAQFSGSSDHRQGRHSQGPEVSYSRTAQPALAAPVRPMTDDGPGACRTDWPICATDAAYK